MYITVRCRLKDNGRRPILFHDFDFAPGKKVCPETFSFGKIQLLLGLKILFNQFTYEPDTFSNNDDV